MPELTLSGLVDDLTAVRHAGGYQFKVQERVLREFAGHCAREGYPDGSITREAVDGFLYGRHLRASTIARDQRAVRQLARHARDAGWDACTVPVPAKVRFPYQHQAPYVFTDEEICRLFAAIDSQPICWRSGKALVDPVLFRVLYGTGLRISEVLGLTLEDVDTVAGTLRIRDAKSGEHRTVPVTRRLAASVAGFITAAHPAPLPGDYLFYASGPGAPASQSTIAQRFHGYLEDAGIPRFPGGPHVHSLRHGFAVANLRRWAAQRADLAAVLSYLACYMGHADLRGTEYYLRLTADAYPEVIALAQVRFGYVIPPPAGDEDEQ